MHIISESKPLATMTGPEIDNAMRNFTQNCTVQIVKESCEVALDWNVPYKLTI